MFALCNYESAQNKWAALPSGSGGATVLDMKWWPNPTQPGPTTLRGALAYPRTRTGAPLDSLCWCTWMQPCPNCEGGPGYPGGGPGGRPGGASRPSHGHVYPYLSNSRLHKGRKWLWSTCFLWAIVEKWGTCIKMPSDFSATWAKNPPAKVFSSTVKSSDVWAGELFQWLKLWMGLNAVVCEFWFTSSPFNLNLDLEEFRMPVMRKNGPKMTVQQHPGEKSAWTLWTGFGGDPCSQGSRKCSGDLFLFTPVRIQLWIRVGIPNVCRKHKIYNFLSGPVGKGVANSCLPTEVSLLGFAENTEELQCEQNVRTSFFPGSWGLGVGKPEAREILLVFPFVELGTRPNLRLRFSHKLNFHFLKPADLDFFPWEGQDKKTRFWVSCTETNKKLQIHFLLISALFRSRRERQKWKWSLLWTFCSKLQ